MGLSVSGFITDSQTQAWQFEPQHEQTLNILVNRTSGDLDPIVTVLGPDGDTLVTNDDRLPGLIYDAGISNLTVDSEEVYTIQVSGYRGAGDYRLWIVPAYAHVWEAESFDGDSSRWTGTYSRQQANQMILDTGRIIGQPVIVSPEGTPTVGDFYLQVEFEWISGEASAAVGLVTRRNDNEGYYFTVTRDGTWALQRQQFGSFQDLLSPTLGSSLNTERVVLGIWLEGPLLRVYGNGQLLGEIEDDTFTAGTWGLILQGTTTVASAAVDNVLLTVPDIPELPNYPATLANWRSATPNDVAAELVEQGIIPDGGRRVFTILSTSYQIAPRLTRIYSQQEGAFYTDMVVSLDVSFEGDNLGCGLVVRRIDEANQVIAFADLDGGVGLLDFRNGKLRHNSYDFMPVPDEPLAGGSTRLLVIAQGDLLTIYANGQYFTTQFIPPTSGEVGVALVNYSTTGARCLFGNLWIWV